MSIRKARKYLIFLVAALLAAQPAAAQRPRHAHHRTEAQRGPHPALWLLEDADTKIYLFGTIHILPRGFRWRSPRFDAAARSADELVMEIASLDAAETREAVVSEMRLGKSAPLLWRVSPERREALQQMVDDLGLPMERLDGMQTWAAAVVLMGMEIVRGMQTADRPEDRAGERQAAEAGDQATGDEAAESADAEEDAAGPPIAPVVGVEGPLEAEFRASHRPVSGVETATQQMRFFSALSFTDQRAFLDAIVEAHSTGEGLGDLRASGDIGQNAWARGNVAAMAVVAESLRGPLYDVLLRRRNAAWTDWLIHRLDRPGTLLFAVGAAHLAGPDSVRAMLAARGFRVRRIQ